MTTERPSTADIFAFADELVDLMRGRPLELVVAAACVALARVARAHPVGVPYISNAMLATARSIRASEPTH